MTDGPSRLAVLGSPIAHSLSPQLHGAAYRALGLDWSYERIEVAEGGLGAFVRGLDAGWRGLSVTMPLKREAATFGGADELVRLTGAANTVVLGERPIVRNTDVAGVIGALDPIDLRAGRVLLLGGGATAASVVAAVAALGAREVSVLVRSASRARALEDLAETLGIVLVLDTLDAAPQLEPPFAVAVNTIPASAGFIARVPDRILATTTLLDVAYAPWPTPAASAWYVGGGTVVAGTEMLLHQAVAQVRLFTAGDEHAPLPAERAVIDAMRAELPVTDMGG